MAKEKENLCLKISQKRKFNGMISIQSYSFSFAYFINCNEINEPEFDFKLKKQIQKTIKK